MNKGNKEEIELVLMYEDIRKETRDKLEDNSIEALYWADFTDEFQKKYFDLYGENGNYDVIPLLVSIDQFMKDGITPVFEWVEVEE